MFTLRALYEGILVEDDRTVDSLHEAWTEYDLMVTRYSSPPHHEQGITVQLSDEQGNVLAESHFA